MFRIGTEQLHRNGILSRNNPEASLYSLHVCLPQTRILSPGGEKALNVYFKSTDYTGNLTEKSLYVLEAICIYVYVIIFGK